MDSKILSFFDCIDMKNNKVSGSLKKNNELSEGAVKTILSRFGIYVENIVLNNSEFSADLIKYEG